MADGGPLSVQPPREERETLRIGEYIWMIRQGRWIILTFVVLSLIASIYITMKTRPVFQSSATFLYDFSSNMSQALDFPGVFWFEVESAKNNQIQIIRSRSMAEAITDSILRSPDSDSLVSLLFDGSAPPPQALRASLVGLVAGSISVSVMKDTDFFVLSAVGGSPEASAVLANLAVQSYYRWNLEEARGENREVREFLDQQMISMDAQLSMDEDSLRSYKESNDFIDLSTQARETVSRLVSLESAAAASRTEIGALGAQRDYLAGSLDEFRAGMADEISSVNDEYISSLQGELALLESSRATLLAGGARPGDPALSDVEAEIELRTSSLSAALEGLVQARFPENPSAAVQSLVGQLTEVEASLRAETTREAVLRRQASLVESELEMLPEAEMNLARLERNRQVSENVYLLLRNRYEEIRIAEAGQIGNVTIIDTALPGGMIRPSRQRNLMMGLLIGLALGLGVVILKQQLDSSISSPEQVEALGVTILGVIPHLPRSSFASRAGRSSVSPSLVTHFAPRDPISEAYRDLRTSLRFARTDKPVRSVLVTSAGPREGKSTTSANLAVTFAQSGQRCILVDADLRRPVLHNLFGLEREPGLSEAAAGVSPLQACLRPTPIENLSLLPSGFIPHNPSELLGSRRIKEIISELSGICDMLIIDSPPMAVVTDALLLSPEVDGTLLVVGAKLGNRRVLQTSLSKLSRSASFIAGAVLNGFDPLRMYTSYGYYTYRYYYYYYSEGSGRKRSRRSR